VQAVSAPQQDRFLLAQRSRRLAAPSPAIRIWAICAGARRTAWTDVRDAKLGHGWVADPGVPICCGTRELITLAWGGT
jgi:hypothetical protein